MALPAYFAMSPDLVKALERTGSPRLPRAVPSEPVLFDPTFDQAGDEDPESGG